MLKPYIGVTGFNTVEQVKAIVEHIDSYPIGYVMFGFTSSNKRLLNPAVGGKTSPPLDILWDLVKAVPSYHLPMIHYFTKNPEQLADEVIALFGYCDLNWSLGSPKTCLPQSYRCGLQLNAEWPDPNQIKKIQDFNSQYNDTPIPITLQIPASALLASNERIIEQLSYYRGLIHYALIDPSGGLGLNVQIERAVQLMQEISQANLDIMPGIAGGFSADNVAERIQQIRLADKCEHCGHEKEFNYCIDAQGKLRDTEIIRPVYPENAPVTEVSTLSIEKTKKYIDNALAAFCER